MTARLPPRTDSNRLLLDEVDTHLQQGIAARDRGERAAARTHFQRAERALLVLARNSRDTALKAQRLEQAQQLHEMAEELARTPPPPAVPAARSSKAGSNPGVPSEDQGRTFAPEPIASDCRFDQVAGLDEAKREIQLRMVLPFAHPDMARRFDINSGGGLLLYGPPGTGKTLIARATAGELDAAFFAIKASDIVSKWFGEAEINVRNLFAAAREHPRSVVFIDEVDAMVPARSKSNSSVMARLVPQFLAELDGFRKSDNSLLVIGATNEPWALDPAMLRPGRLDVLVYVGLPDIAGRRRLLELHLGAKPLDADVDLDRLADRSEGLSGADLKGFAERAAREGFEASLAGPERPLHEAQLEALLAATPRSVGAEYEARYHRFRQASGR